MQNKCFQPSFLLFNNYSVQVTAKRITLYANAFRDRSTIVKFQTFQFTAASASSKMCCNCLSKTLSAVIENSADFPRSCKYCTIERGFNESSSAQMSINHGTEDKLKNKKRQPKEKFQVGKCFVNNFSS